MLEAHHYLYVQQFLVNYNILTNSFKMGPEQQMETCNKLPKYHTH